MRRIVVVAGVVGLLLAACGQSESPEQRLAAATESTSSAGSAEFSMEMAMDMRGGSGDASGESSGGQAASGMSMTITGEGVMDFDSQIGRLSLQVPGLGSAMETIYDGDTVYTRVPAMLTGGEAQWVRQQSPGLAQGMSATSGMGGDPTDMLQALGAASGEIEELGSDEARGDSVQGYGFTVTASELQGAQGVPDSVADMDIPTEAWLDSEGRLRRMVAEIDVGEMARAAADSAEGSGGSPSRAFGDMAGAMGGTMTMTMELWNFGTSVDVEPPDEAQVIDAKQLHGQMGQGFGGGPGQGSGSGSAPSSGASGAGGSGMQMPESPEEAQRMIEDLMERAGS